MVFMVLSPHVSATDAALVDNRRKIHADRSRRSEVLHRPEGAATARLARAAQARDNSLHALPRPEREPMKIMLIRGAAVVVALGLCAACAPIGSYVASHKTDYVFPRGGGGGGGGNGG
jgi:hypothetical protein